MNIENIEFLYGLKIETKPHASKVNSIMYKIPNSTKPAKVTGTNSIVVFDNEETIIVSYLKDRYVDYRHRINKKGDLIKSKLIDKTFTSKGHHSICISFKKNKCVFYVFQRKNRARHSRIYNYNKKKNQLNCKIRNFVAMLSFESGPYIDINPHTGIITTLKSNHKTSNSEEIIINFIKDLIVNKIKKHGYYNEWKHYL